MAKLIRNEDQVNAFKEVTAMLQEVAAINERILLKDEPIAIALGKKKTIQIDDSLADKIIAVLKTQRQKRIKDIIHKANKFRISLDKEEQVLISDEAIQTANNDEEPKKSAESVETVDENDDFDEISLFDEEEAR